MGRAPCCDKANVKRGPWSPEEDAILRDYMDRFGTCSNWIALPHKAGLKRCGKSCRLRWLNYLRPNIKHGEFSDEEDRVICTLYATIGSRWSIIAGQLPGRTDNDIKNYWNTKLKKKLMGMITIPQQQWKPLPPSPPPPPPPPASSDLSQYHNFITNPSSLLTSQFLPPLMNLNYSSTTTTPDYTYKSPYFVSETNTSLANTSLQVQDDSFSFLGFGNDDQVMTMMNGSSSVDGSSRDIKQEADQTLIMFQDQGSSSSSYYTKSNIITSAAFGNNNNASDEHKLLNVNNATDCDEAATHGDDHALLEDVKRLICSHDLTQEKKKAHEEKNMHYFW